MTSSARETTDAAPDAVLDVDGAGPVVLPAAFNVTDATFERAGTNLVLTDDDGGHVVVQGYFATATPPTLIGAGGVAINGRTAADLAGPVATAQYTADGGVTAEPIGAVDKLLGTVSVTRYDGRSETLQVGDQVFQGDILETGHDSGIGLVLADETTFSLGENGRIILDELIYAPDAAEGSLNLSVLHGVFTFVSGHIAKVNPEAMVLTTPVATIGVRGTQIGVDVGEEGDVFVAMMEEADGFVGEVVVGNAGGSVTLNLANQFTSVTDGSVAPTAAALIDPTNIVRTFDAPLRVLPLHDTGANDYGLQGDFLDVGAMDLDSLDDLADFTTAAGPDGPFEGRAFDAPALDEVIRVVNAVYQPVRQEPSTPASGFRSDEPPNNTDSDVRNGSDTGARSEAPTGVPETPTNADTGGGETGGGGAGSGESEDADLPKGEPTVPAQSTLTLMVSNATTHQAVINASDSFTLAAPAAFGDVSRTTGADMDIRGVQASSAVDVIYTAVNQADVSLTSAWNSIKNIQVSSPDAASVTLDNFVHVDVALGNGGDSTVIITDAKRGTVVTGDGADIVTIDARTNGHGWSNLFDVNTGAGDDTVSVTGDRGTTDINISAGAGNDTITVDGAYDTAVLRGGAGDDTITGGDRDDVLIGGAGDDVLEGGAGNDVLIGGDGDDVARFQGAWADHDVAWDDDGGLRVTNGVGETDTLYGIERLHFDDEEILIEALFGSAAPDRELVGGTPEWSLDDHGPLLDPYAVQEEDLVAPEDGSPVVVTFESEEAGYRNTVGWYRIDENGRPDDAYLLWANASAEGSGGDLKPGESEVVLEGLEAGDRFGLFIVSDGARQHRWLNEVDDGWSLRFDETRNLIATDGEREEIIHAVEGGNKGHIFHATESNRSDGQVHASSGVDPESGNVMIGFEDLKGGGDRDYDDVVISIRHRPADESYSVTGGSTDGGGLGVLEAA